MIVTIHQPNYLPYLGLFHKVARADVFVLYDTALYSRQLGFHNRNRIKTPLGAQWLTVPVRHETIRTIRDVQIVDEPWGSRHGRTIEANYRRAPFYESYADDLHTALKKPWSSLADLNETLLSLVARWLSVSTKIVRSSALPQPATEDPTGKLVHFVRTVGGDVYLSGHGGHLYLDGAQFSEIRLEYDEFTPSSYPQLFGEFVPNLSAIDAVFNLGDAARRHVEPVPA